jgi:hypothetical protein
MARKRSDTSKSVESPTADDLKLINGVGPAVESRLHGVGIFTFAQLTALSPADIAASVADLTGLTAERIIKQDWIGQARQLAAEVVEAAPEVAPLVRAKSLSGALYLHEMEMIVDDERDRRSMLASNQPLEMHLTLDLTDVVIPDDSPLAYKAFVYGRCIGEQTRRVMGEATGTFTPSGKTNVSVKGITLSPGIYYLEAIVTLTRASEEASTGRSLMALTRRGPLHFY